MQRGQAGVVLTLPVSQPVFSCTGAVRVLGSAETTRVWDGSAEVDIDESSITGRFEGAPALLLWGREELQWFDAGEHLQDQAVEDLDEAHDPSTGLAASPTRYTLLRVLLASAAVAFVLALLCISALAAR